MLAACRCVNTAPLHRASSESYEETGGLTSASSRSTNAFHDPFGGSGEIEQRQGPGSLVEQYFRVGVEEPKAAIGLSLPEQAEANDD